MSKIRQSMEAKSTEELLKIWEEIDTEQWSPEAFDVVKQLLEERGATFSPKKIIIKKVEEQIRPFVSARVVAVFVTILFVITTFLDILKIMSIDLSLIDLSFRVMEGKAVTQVEVEKINSGIIASSKVLRNVYIFTGVLFFIWIYRVHGNLPALGARHLRFTPGWAVGWFFIPFMNLFRPYQVVQEIWKASDPFYADDHTWKTTRSSPIIRWWWILFLMSTISGNFVAKVIGFEIEPKVFHQLARIKLISDGLDIVAAILAILVVRAINARQKEKSKRFA